MSACRECLRELRVGEIAWASDWTVIDETGTRTETRYICDDCDQATAARGTVYGYCTACRSVEVALNEATGTRDLSGIGESAEYPTGYGCELCA